MAALPLPVAILDDLICRKEMRSSKMATGSGRAAIFHLHLNGDRKKYPILLTYEVLYNRINLHRSTGNSDFYIEIKYLISFTSYDKTTSSFG